MKNFLLFSKDVAPSKSRNLVAISWWIWTLSTPLIVLFSEGLYFYVDAINPISIFFTIQFILLYGIKQLPTNQVWNFFLIIAAILTFNPFYLIAFFSCIKERKTYILKNVHDSNSRNIILMGWFLNWAGIIWLGYIINSYALLLILFLIPQTISYLGIIKISKSSGWAVYYIIIGIVTIQPFYVFGGILSLSEKNKVERESNLQVDKSFIINDNSNFAYTRTPSTARKTILIGWWLRLILILLFVLLISTGSYDYEQILIVVLILISIPQIIAYNGMEKIPESSGWAIYYIIIGLFVLDPFYLIGGFLARSEKNKIDNNKLFKNLEVTLQTNLFNDSNKSIEDILKLKNLMDSGAITEDEFVEAKKKMLDEI